ncbi:hypothetical protein QQM79_00015 [Marinobacteraceae bacterium S3BR75-40.1]
MKNAFVLLMSVLASGCVNLIAQKPDENYSTSIVDTLDQYSEATEAGLIDPYRLYDPTGKSPGVVDGGKYRGFMRWWCLDSSSSKSELKNLISDHCSKMNGVYSNNWCYGKKSELPLYKVAVGGASLLVERSNVPFCSTSEDVGVLAYEKRPNTPKEDWRNIALSELGYISPTENKERLRVEREKRARALERKRKKQLEQAQLVLASKRGTRICKDFDGGSQFYVGYIEDRTDEKVKINVTQAVLRNSTRFITNSGFQPTIVWEYPVNWYVCE